MDVLQLQVLLPSLLPPATSGPQPLVQGCAAEVQLVILSCSPAGQLAVPPPLPLEPFAMPELEPELLEITLPELLPPPPVEPPLVEPAFEEFAAALPDPVVAAEPEEVPPKGPLPGSGAGPLSELPLADELGEPESPKSPVVFTAFAHPEGTLPMQNSDPKPMATRAT